MKKILTVLIISLITISCSCFQDIPKIKLAKKYITTDSGDIAFYNNGKEGTPIIFVHGYRLSKDVWNWQLKYFHDLGFNVLAVDMYGHGDTTLTRKAVSYDDLIEDLRNVIVSEKVENPIIVGHSFGGMVSMKYAEKYPDEVGKLVLVATSGNLNIAETTSLRAKYKTFKLIRHLLKLIPDCLAGHVNNMFAETPVEKDDQLFDLIMDIDVNYEALRGVETLVVSGRDDDTIDYRNSKKLYENIDGSKLLTVGKGHQIFFDNHFDVNSGISRFVLGME
jgi:pimeloyl-ACP methyl ester carboxylesterase